MPTIAVLKPGILTVYEVEGNPSKFFVSSGSLSMNIDGSCQILAEEIAALDDLDNQVFVFSLKNTKIENNLKIQKKTNKIENPKNSKRWKFEKI